MRTAALLIALSIASCAPGATASADNSALVISLGVGAGWGETTDNVLRLYDDYVLDPRLHDRESGASLEFGAGYRLSREMFAGVELLAWSRRADDDLDAAHLDLVTAAAALTWFPWRDGPFARLGYGLGTARLDYLERGSWRNRRDTGAAYLLALGWELDLGGVWSLSPRISHTAFATRELDVWASLTTLTIALTIEP